MPDSHDKTISVLGMIPGCIPKLSIDLMEEWMERPELLAIAMRQVKEQHALSLASVKKAPDVKERLEDLQPLEIEGTVFSFHTDLLGCLSEEQMEGFMFGLLCGSDGVAKNMATALSEGSLELLKKDVKAELF